MDDIERRIASVHLSVQLQGAQKLVKLLEDDLDQSSWSTVHEYFWKSVCLADKNSVSSTCCEALVPLQDFFNLSTSHVALIHTGD